MIKEDQNHVICPNCENEFEKQFDYCPNCGQKNRSAQLYLKHFLHDFLDSAFSIDSKFFQTFKLLITKPGFLSKEFLSGKRSKYLTPIRIYLIVSLVYFTLLSFVAPNIVKVNESNDDEKAVADSMKTVVDSVKYGELNRKNTDLPESTIITMNNIEDLEKVIEQDKDSVSVAEEKSKLEKFVMSRLKKVSTDEGKKTATTMFRKYSSIGMFILMPVTALLFFLLFYKGTYYIEHLVFTLHLQSVMFVLFIVYNLVELLIEHEVVDLIIAGLFMILLVSWIKHFYNVKWFKSIWKSLLFLLMYEVILLIFIVIVGVITAWNL